MNLKSILLVLALLCLQSEAFAERTYHYFFGIHQEDVFSTPDELGQYVCPTIYNNTYGRVQPNPNFNGNNYWGSLFCDIGGGQEQGKGIIIAIVCPDSGGSQYFQCPSQPPEPDKDDDPDCGGVGNPCNPSTGNKFQIEKDIVGAGLSFTRYYSSGVLVDRRLGVGWRSNLQQTLSLNNNSLVYVSSKGRGETWNKIGGIWEGDIDSDYIISEDSTGLFRVDNKDGSFEEYNRLGQLTTLTDSQGFETSYIYNTNSWLTSVIDHYGNSLQLNYTDGKISSVEDLLGAVYSYEYDTNNNLAIVIYPDGTPSDNTDNPRKTYHYENPNYPNHLTGITDENDTRYATYAYDADGKAISTEHSQTTNTPGQERFELDYQ